MPALNIKDPDVHALAAELARRTGRSLTDSVKTALEESLRRRRSTQKDPRRIVARVMQIGRRASSRPVLDRRAPEEILGYDESGIPR
jgi:antitoxin VapB